MPPTRARPLQLLPGDVLVGEWQELLVRNREQGTEEQGKVIYLDEPLKMFYSTKVSVLITSFLNITFSKTDSNQKQFFFNFLSNFDVSLSK